MRIEDKVIVVTGAANGIGKEIALNLISRGARIAACDINNEALDELQKKTGKERLSKHLTDITDKSAVEKLPKEIISIHKDVDGIINNAGIIQPFVKVNDLEYKDIERVMNINFYGTLYMVKAFLPYLLKRPEAHIVNVSSMGGFLPVPGQGVYGASKAAVKLLTEALYAELSGTNVRVSAVFPGATQTNITQNSGLKAPKSSKENSKIPMLLPSDAAKLIVDGMEKNNFQIFTGKDSSFMNKLYRLSPRFATNFIAKQMKSLLDG